MTIDPTKDFRESESGKRWHEAVASNWFQDGIKAGLLAVTFPPPADMGSAAANEWRRDGVNRFVWTLLNLTEPKRPAAPTVERSNLNHTV